MRSAILFNFLFAFTVELAAQEPKHYQSPYEVKFVHQKAELLRDLEEGSLGDWRDEAKIPHSRWYSKEVRDHYGAWGPPARHYPPSPIAVGKSAAWRRERVLAVGLRFVGYRYQHHHSPDWDPPVDWPWLKVAAGHNGKGLDFSNYTAFCYNLALGIKPTGNVRVQSEKLEIEGADGKVERARRIEIPSTYSEFPKTFETGDLLYIKGSPDREVTHVVIWVGRIGKNDQDIPLVLDSHGQGVKDCNGTTIPDGIHLRPFKEKSWYHRCASHAHRIVHGD